MDTSAFKRTLAISASAVYSVLRFLFEQIVLDSFKGYALLHKLMKESARDEQISGLIDSFKQEYLDGGWKLLLSVNRTVVLVAIIVGVCVMDTNHPYFGRFIKIYPLVFVVLIFLDKVSKRFNLQEICFIVLVMFFGLLSLNSNLIKPSYSLFEMWVVYI